VIDAGSLSAQQAEEELNPSAMIQLLTVLSLSLSGTSTYG
jgi:hypothetical protein